MSVGPLDFLLKLEEFILHAVGDYMPQMNNYSCSINYEIDKVCFDEWEIKFENFS